MSFFLLYRNLFDEIISVARSRKQTGPYETRASEIETAR